MHKKKDQWEEETKDRFGEDRMAKTTQQPLVAAHINGAKVAIILKCFREFIGRQKCGVYVLRKDGDIYYVGLASSLRARLAYLLTREFSFLPGV